MNTFAEPQKCDRIKPACARCSEATILCEYPDRSDTTDNWFPIQTVASWGQQSANDRMSQGAIQNLATLPDRNVETPFFNAPQPAETSISSSPSPSSFANEKHRYGSVQAVNSAQIAVHQTSDNTVAQSPIQSQFHPENPISMIEPYPHPPAPTSQPATPPVDYRLPTAPADYQVLHQYPPAPMSQPATRPVEPTEYTPALTNHINTTTGEKRGAEEDIECDQKKKCDCSTEDHTMVHGPVPNHPHCLNVAAQCFQHQYIAAQQQEICALRKDMDAQRKDMDALRKDMKALQQEAIALKRTQKCQTQNYEQINNMISYVFQYLWGNFQGGATSLSQ
jgi:hypothetical protein